MVEQIPKIKPPKAEGPVSNTPHAFQMSVNMSPHDIGLLRTIPQTLAEGVQYPIIARRNGVVVIRRLTRYTVP